MTGRCSCPELTSQAAQSLPYEWRSRDVREPALRSHDAAVAVVALTSARRRDQIACRLEESGGNKTAQPLAAV